MKHMSIYHYKPEISLEQILAYRSNQPETHTRSVFVNTVCKSFESNGYMSAKDMAQSIGMSSARFLDTFEVLTGLRYTQLRAELVGRKARELRKLHPYWSTDKIAKSLGFNTRASLWSMIPKEDYEELLVGTREHIIKQKVRAARQQIELEVDLGS